MGFRDYAAPARDTVDDFYRDNHRYQTFEFANERRDHFRALNQTRMGVWAACEMLDRLTDDSDPDTELTQIEHLVQTAEAIRADGHPRWFVLAGLVHDLGKILCLFGEPQWAVTGDTFPLGCRFSESIVYHEYFADNPDSRNPAYSTDLGIYDARCGLDKVTMSWGHDEYMYWVAKDYLPESALYMIRYHSFYAAHEQGAYTHLMSDRDKDMFRWVKRFNAYDLYSKGHARPDVKRLAPWYRDLIDEFFPSVIPW